MTKDEQQRLYNDLAEEMKLIEGQLKEIASENPVTKGSFEARVEDLGDSMEDAAEELASLDQRQAMVIQLKKRYKEVQNAMTKIKAGKYGICEKCSVQIKKERLIAMPIAVLCINCAKIAR